MIHLPILRHGVPYKSLDVVRLPHYRTREPFVEISQANAGLIRRDLRPERQADARRALARIPFDSLIAMCTDAADRFLTDTLPLGDAAQSPDDYVVQLSVTTGMPHALVRRNMQRVAGVMREMRTVLRGLTRGHAERVAEAVAAELATIVPRAEDDEQATLAPFVDPRVAERISAQVDSGLDTAGAREVTLDHRESPRLATFNGATYLQPTVILCDGPDHPLANREFLFPFVSVVKVDREQMDRMPELMGKTLVVTALTRDRRLIEKLPASPYVDRLNIGANRTNQISWDQPHEGDLFEHLYARRSFQRSSDAAFAAAAGA
jgi:hypothetical protein